MAGTRKNFELTDEWNPETAHVVERFFRSLVDEQVMISSGTYTGKGIDQTITMSELVGTPLIVFLLNTSSNAIATVLQPFSTGHITAWTSTSFTLLSSSTMNTQGTAYKFIAVARGS